MFNLSVKAEYALQAIFDLALQKPGVPIKIADIAERQHIPQKFLELILASLKQGGFVESRRGAEGGYLLARASNTISIGDVLRFVENKKGRRRTESPFADLWRQVDSNIADVTDGTNFGDLARSWQEKRAKYVADWVI
ncbi:MAG: Rrf2 family transcriptional regulator [Bryobacteraceae bacterium]|nr:Rrf2 family transcriptional regulator [Bryobacteraceae bacterium]